MFGSVLSFLGGIVGKLISTFGMLLLAFRAGQKSQKASDDAASLKDAEDARRIESDVSRLTDSDLNNELRRPGPNS